ncbi:MAG: pH regulation protein F [Planctomycetota bacterium]|nr:MAG: pH regulation protein F [Planctomycetota bacterium]
MLSIAVSVAGGLIVISLLLSLIRLLRGPTLADAVIALDLITTLAVGAMGVTALATGHKLYIDIALVVGLVAFLATVALGTLVEYEGRRKDA